MPGLGIKVATSICGGKIKQVETNKLQTAGKGPLTSHVH